MAVPSYATDLASTTANASGGTFMRQDSTAALTLTGCLGTIAWSEPTGATAGGIATEDIDYFILGVATVDKTFNATGLGGIAVTTTTAALLPTDGAFFVWANFICPNAVNTIANGGIQVIVGSAQANYKKYYVGGDDTNLLGGWKCYAVNSTVTQSATQGTPTATNQYIGVIYNVDNAVGKGQPAAVGGMRFGRGYIQVTAGDVTTPATFDGISVYNNYNDATNGWNRLGILQKIGGTFQHQGLLSIGTAAAACYFVDSNQTVSIASTEFVTPAFNKYEIRNASTSASFTSCNFLSLTTASKGRFECVDDATVLIDSCAFNRMDTFIFKPKTTVIGSSFIQCGQVTQGSAPFTNSTFDKCTASSAILTTTPNLITDCSFISDGSGHAIEITTLGASASFTTVGNTFTGYAGTAGASGTSGNEAIYNNSGRYVEINITSGTVPAYRNGTGSTTKIIAGLRTLTITNIAASSEVRIYLAGTTTELAGEENNITGSFAYSYTYAANTYVDIVVHHVDYIYFRINNQLLLDENGSQPIQQQRDRQYLNP